jgi:hypothetical protein
MSSYPVVQFVEPGQELRVIRTTEPLFHHVMRTTEPLSHCVIRTTEPLFHQVLDIVRYLAQDCRATTNVV